MDHNLNVLKAQQLLKLIYEVLRSIRKKWGTYDSNVNSVLGFNW